jgi:guanylate kinase|tara:strand:+ start:2948 stop:3583 length:636 start_codon:yes stop_codon:yes gene_type:complete
LSENLKNKGMLIIISSPSGAGKTSLCKKLLEIDKTIKPSISVTTREPRKNEINGEDYIFVTKNDFNLKIESDEFLEYATVFNNKYGTLISSTNLLLNKKFDVLFDIDWQGTQQLSQNNDNILTIFILPPNKQEIEKRLRERESKNSENTDIIKERMSKFEDELSHWKEYDYVVTNDNFDKCISEIIDIISAERKKRSRQTSLFDTIRDLTS